MARLKLPPRIWGKKPSPRRSLVKVETERPHDIVIVVVVGVVVVECYCFLRIIIDGGSHLAPPQNTS